MSYQLVQGFNSAASAVTSAALSAAPLERYVKMLNKAVKLAGKILGGNLKACISQLSGTHEILSAVQLLPTAKDIFFADSKGIPFFKRVSWQKGLSRVSLLFFLAFSSYALIKKWKPASANPENLQKRVKKEERDIRPDVAYLFFALFAGLEFARIGEWYKAGGYAGKTLLSLTGLASMQFGPDAVSLVASLLTDIFVGINWNQ